VRLWVSSLGEQLAGGWACRLGHVNWMLAVKNFIAVLAFALLL